MTILRTLGLAVAIAACAGPPAGWARPHKEARATRKTRGSKVMTQTCEAARKAIEAGRFIGWHGLPSGCAPDALLGVPLDGAWGELPLGKSFERARSRLLEIGGYYRPMAYVRDGVVVMFDGMNPTLDGGWTALSADLGTPEATLDWVHGTVPMPGGERVYARRGITIFLNPENDFVIHVSVYVPTTVDEYVKRLQPSREKRPLPMK